MSGYIWLGHYGALYVHDRLLTLNVGAAGIRNNGLLESALARPVQSFNDSKNVNIAALAAPYIIGIVKSILLWMATSSLALVWGFCFWDLTVAGSRQIR